MRDIETDDDVRELVDSFYGSIQQDALLNPIFTDVAQVDWSHHLPKMYAFWNGIIRGVPGYAGAPFPLHAVLPVSLQHFQRWVELFHATVDRAFSGPGATRAKNAAASIAHTFAMRMRLIEPTQDHIL
ncbi:MAG: group III truncated hemoglobin [Opitutaceae bacterium]|nr:group III truncated hemoglobin [Opitutaceae bacterium]